MCQEGATQIPGGCPLSSNHTRSKLLSAYLKAIPVQGLQMAQTCSLLTGPSGLADNSSRDWECRKA